MQRVLISGASGLIGSTLAPHLQLQGIEVVRLVRRPPASEQEILWDPERHLSRELASGFDAVVHLSGESVAGRWSESRKARIRNSRIASTRNLAQALASASKPPAAFICASAIGYYGDRGSEVLTEESEPGRGFLAEVCREWESATAAAAQAGIRVVNLRIGIVLGRDGGALKPMLMPFRLGVGGRAGHGDQWWSWIHLADLVAAIVHILTTELRGPVNLTAPGALRNTEFAKIIGKVLHRPALLPTPAWALRLALGEFADQGVLASARVEPAKLLVSGFRFKFPALEPALLDVLTTN
jgi:uncharacterized protein (TIGR01777 family)